MQVDGQGMSTVGSATSGVNPSTTSTRSRSSSRPTSSSAPASGRPTSGSSSSSKMTMTTQKKTKMTVKAKDPSPSPSPSPSTGSRPTRSRAADACARSPSLSGEASPTGSDESRERLLFLLQVASDSSGAVAVAKDGDPYPDAGAAPLGAAAAEQQGKKRKKKTKKTAAHAPRLPTSGGAGAGTGTGTGSTAGAPSTNPSPSPSPSRSSPRKRRRRAVPRKRTFAEKLMSVLSDPTCQDAISWLPDGTSFVIVSPHLFASTVLPRYFKSAKFESFTRKLNRWGFKRITRGGSSAVAYCHHLFQRGQPDLCSRMKGDGGLRATDEEREAAAAVGIDPRKAQGLKDLTPQQIRERQLQQQQLRQQQQQQQQQHQQHYSAAVSSALPSNKKHVDAQATKYVRNTREAEQRELELLRRIQRQKDLLPRSSTSAILPPPDSNNVRRRDVVTQALDRLAANGSYLSLHQNSMAMQQQQGQGQSHINPFILPKPEAGNPAVSTHAHANQILVNAAHTQDYTTPTSASTAAVPPKMNVLGGSYPDRHSQLFSGGPPLPPHYPYPRIENATTAAAAAAAGTIPSDDYAHALTDYYNAKMRLIAARYEAGSGAMESSLASATEQGRSYPHLLPILPSNYGGSAAAALEAAAEYEAALQATDASSSCAGSGR